jgi:uncharacterized protein (TIGR02246 family)
MMKRTALALGIVLAAASATAADAGLTDIEKAWTKAALANDVAAISALYAPDAIMYPPDEMEWKGREAIQKGYEGLLRDMKVLEAKLTPAGMETFGDKSIGWGRYTLKLAPKAGGDPVVLEGRYTALAKKIKGKWLYVSDHASSPLPPPPAPVK